MRNLSGSLKDPLIAGKLRDFVPTARKRASPLARNISREALRSACRLARPSDRRQHTATPDITMLRELRSARARLAPKMGAAYLVGMRIIARRTLREFVESRAGHRDQPALKAAVDAWFDEARKAKWSSTADVKRLYASASIISSERIVFNIRGNAYRLVVAVDFDKGIVWIKWLGTHRDYDRIDVKEVDLE